MTAIVLHGDRVGDRAVGKPRVAAAASLRDPATAVTVARRLMLSDAWRSAPRTGDAVDKAWYFLRVHTPAALAVLPRSAVAGLTRPVPLGGCSWCLAAFHAALSFGADAHPPRNELTLAFLGRPCGRCSARHATSDAVAASLAQYLQLVAAGVPPKVAAASRTPEEAWRRMAEIRAVEEARLPKASPPTRPLQASGRRKVPAPSYYRPRPVSWPANARRAR